MEAHCPRYGSSRHRKPNRTDRTCALLITFALLYISANVIVVSMLKLVSMAYLLISVRKRSRWRPLIYRIVEAVGRWSVVDVFVTSILVALVSARIDRRGQR